MSKISTKLWQNIYLRPEHNELQQKQGGEVNRPLPEKDTTINYKNRRPVPDQWRHCYS